MQVLTKQACPSHPSQDGFHIPRDSLHLVCVRD